MKNMSTVTSSVQMPVGGGQPIAQNVMFVAPPGGKHSKVMKNYAGKASVVLGAIQICCGAILMLTNVVAYFPPVISRLYGRVTLAYPSTGIWGGIIFIITGVFGIIAGKRKTKCPIITYLVMSIISSVLTIGPLLSGAVSASVDNSSYRSYYYSSPAPGNPGVVVVYSIFILAALIEAGVAIVSSALGCAAFCCGKTERGMVGYVPYYVTNAEGATQMMLQPVGGAGMTQIGVPSMQNFVPQQGQCMQTSESQYAQPAQILPPPSYTVMPGVGPTYTGPIAPQYQPAQPPTPQPQAHGGMAVNVNEGLPGKE